MKDHKALSLETEAVSASVSGGTAQSVLSFGMGALSYFSWRLKGGVCALYDMFAYRRLFKSRKQSFPLHRLIILGPWILVEGSGPQFPENPKQWVFEAGLFCTGLLF